jgi:hypothetical protein
MSRVFVVCPCLLISADASLSKAYAADCDWVLIIETESFSPVREVYVPDAAS